MEDITEGMYTLYLCGVHECDHQIGRCFMTFSILFLKKELKRWHNSQYLGYTWRQLVDADLSCHMVLRSTCRFLPHTVKSFHSSFHTINMVGNHSDEIVISESISIKEDLV